MRHALTMSDQDLRQAIENGRAIIDPCTSETSWLAHLEWEYEVRQIKRRFGLNTRQGRIPVYSPDYAK